MIRTIRHIVLIILLFVAQAGARFAADFWGPMPQSFESCEVNIPPRVSARRIGHILQNHQVVPSALHFLIVAQYQGLARRLNPGTFQFDRPMPVWEVVNKIATYVPKVYWVTIPEGFTLERIAEELSENTGHDVEQYHALIHDEAFINKQDILAGDLQGYLFPDSYLFDLEWKPEQVLREMVRRFQQIWSGLQGDWDPEKPCIVLGKQWTPHQIVTLASIIEREGRFFSEYPRIAGVFYNRLNQNMKLESCATVRFAINDWRKRLTLTDLQFDSPYNTYQHKGLPPGPICSPGRAALQAALIPLETEELFFVARSDGWHDFTRTHSEHVRAKRRNR